MTFYELREFFNAIFVLMDHIDTKYWEKKKPLTLKRAEKVVLEKIITLENIELDIKMGKNPNNEGVL